MKKRSLPLTVVVLLGLLCGTGIGQAQASTSGTVVAWGDNTVGQTNVPAGLSGVTAVDAGNTHNLALKSDGTVVAWGDNTYGRATVPTGLTIVTAISAGQYHSLALKADGTIVGWGDNYFGQINVPAGLTGVTAVSAGVYHSLALKSDGTVVAWGHNGDGQTNVPGAANGAIAISAGSYHNLALKTDGTVVAWGDNANGQTDVPADLSGVIAISAGLYHNLALKADGTVVAWGINFNGQSTVPAGLSNVTAVSAGAYYSLALKGDGTVVAWGCNDEHQTEVPPGLTGVFAISAGGYHGLALTPGPAATAPVVTSHPQSQSAKVGDLVSFSAAASGEPAPTVQWQQSTDGGATWANIAGAIASPLTFSAALDQSGDQYRAVFTNSAGSATSDAATLTANSAPVAALGGPYLGAINTGIAFDGSASSDADSDPLTYAWSFGDGNTGTGVVPTRSYAATGIYDVCLTVNDGTVDSSPVCTMAVVYDPSAGFVTGGGWILSPAGAYEVDPSLSGEATFGFVSKYKKGASVPEGNSEFQFEAGGFEFHSTAYDWLVISKDKETAQFKGAGLVNGAPDLNGHAYKFMLWASDGNSLSGLDTFRIRIWREDADGAEQEVYDNGFNQEISGGSIVVHTR